MAGNELLYKVENGVAYFTINREEKRNSISGEVLKGMMQNLALAEADESVRAVCITGAGAKAFCTGADLAGGVGDSGFAGFANMLKRIAAFPKPTVARVNGFCLAGGMGFMLACDIAIAADTAKFGTPEVNVGLWPMMIGALIFRNAGRKKAMEMMLLGEKFSAAEAVEMGLITRAVPADKLDAEVGAVLTVLAKKSPIGMKIGKEAFYAAADMPFEQQLDFFAKKIAEVASTQDAVEGITAFIQKREPVFKGK